MILAIDTSAGQCAVALLQGGEVIAHRETMERGHAECLFPMIEAVLDQAAATYDDLTRIAVCTGPGSFTGLRIGVAAARGLGLGCGIPVIGITRFEALAAGQVGAGQVGTVRLRGRGQTHYAQDFDDTGAPLGDPYLCRNGGAVEDDPLPDPVTIACLARDRTADAPPAPLYLRGADADPPRDAPPILLDG